MCNTDDLYEILQVHYNAEPEVIQAAYRRLARKYHPDVNRKYHPDVNRSPDAEENMKRLTLLTKYSAIRSSAGSMTANGTDVNGRDKKQRSGRPDNDGHASSRLNENGKNGTGDSELDKKTAGEPSSRENAGSGLQR